MQVLQRFMRKVNMRGGIRLIALRDTELRTFRLQNDAELRKHCRLMRLLNDTTCFALKKSFLSKIVLKSRST